MTGTMIEPNRNAANKKGKYLTFALGQEEYGLEILSVREIIGYTVTEGILRHFRD